MDTKIAKRVNCKLLVAALLLGAMASESVLAHGPYRGGPRVSVGFSFGAPFAPYPFYRPYYYSPFYYPPAFYPPAYYPPVVQAYYPPVVVAPAAPPVYVEQQAPQYPQSQAYPQQQFQQYQQPAEEAPASSGSMWYYCADSKTYYPYVEQCPAGWQQVTPQPRS